MAPVVAAALIGAGATIGSTLYNNYQSNKAQEAELEARKEAAEQLRQQGKITDAQYNQVISQINQYYNQRGSLGTKQDVNQYKAAIQGYNPEDYAYNFGDYEYDKTKEDFLNPYYGRNDNAAGTQFIECSQYRFSDDLQARHKKHLELFNIFFFQKVFIINDRRLEVSPLQRQMQIRRPAFAPSHRKMFRSIET